MASSSASPAHGSLEDRKWNVGKVAPTHVEIHDIRSAEKLASRKRRQRRSRLRVHSSRQAGDLSFPDLNATGGASLPPASPSGLRPSASTPSMRGPSSASKVPPAIAERAEEQEKANKERLEKTRAEVMRLRTEHDNLRAERTKLRARIKGSEAALQDFEREHNLEGEDTSAEEKQLASLEAKIAEAKEEMEAAIYYERSLLHVATRMKRDATTFDRTIAEFRTSAVEGERELSELLVSVHEERQQKDRKIAEYKAAKAALEEEQSTLEQHMRTLEKTVQAREAVASRLVRKGAISPMDNRARSRSRTASVARRASATGADESMARAAALAECAEGDAAEALLTRVRLTTGLTDPAEIIERFNTRGELHKNLDDQMEVMESQAKRLSGVQANLEQQLQTVQLSSQTSAEPDRQAMERLGTEQEEMRRKLNYLRDESSRIDRVLLGMRQNLGVLLDKLRAGASEDQLPDAPPSAPVGHGRTKLGNELQAMVEELKSFIFIMYNDRSVSSTLRRSSLSFRDMSPRSERRGAAPATPGRDLPEKMEALVRGNPNNVRVRPPSAGGTQRAFAGADGPGSGPTGVGAAGDMEAVSRSQIGTPSRGSLRNMGSDEFGDLRLTLTEKMRKSLSQGMLVHEAGEDEDPAGNGVSPSTTASPRRGKKKKKAKKGRDGDAVFSREDMKQLSLGRVYQQQDRRGRGSPPGVRGQRGRA